MSTLKVNKVQTYSGAGDVLVLNGPLALSGNNIASSPFTSIANGSGSVSFGTGNTASAAGTLAIGNGNNIVQGSIYSFAGGSGNTITSDAWNSLAMGSENTVGFGSNQNMAAIGATNSWAKYTNSVVSGIHVTSSQFYQFNVGKYNQADINARLVVGAGSGVSARRNVLAVHDDKLVLSGSLLMVSGSDTIVKIETLPTSDPGTAGQLFTTQSAGTGGNLDGTAFRVLCVSQG